jgi:hypothetical protein
VTTSGGLREGLLRSVEPWGGLTRDLVVGPWTIRLEGLDAETARIVEGRWGGFVRDAMPAPPSALVSVRRASASLPFLQALPGESYRMEAAAGPGPIVVRSYAFAIGAAPGGGWRLAVADRHAEPPGRILDNAARWTLARLATEAGGLTLHGAGVLRGGRAFIFAGPSGSGKSTAVRLTGEAASLGDDFAVAVPQGGAWSVHAVPFDNAEVAPEAGARGPFPLAAVYRLFQAKTARVDRPAAPRAQASLMACVAFPWALPDLAPRIDAAVDALVGAGRFAHLEFAVDAGFWSAIDSEA